MTAADGPVLSENTSVGEAQVIAGPHSVAGDAQTALATALAATLSSTQQALLAAMQRLQAEPLETFALPLHQGRSVIMTHNGITIIISPGAFIAP
jgi:hypothetical protein